MNRQDSTSGNIKNPEIPSDQSIDRNTNFMISNWPDFMWFLTATKKNQLLTRMHVPYILLIAFSSVPLQTSILSFEISFGVVLDFTFGDA